TISDSTISGNKANGGGGVGSYSYSGSAASLHNVTILRSTISANSSLFDGGGVGTSGANLVLENSTLYNNYAANSGGGLWTGTSVTYTGSAAISFVTVAKNTAMVDGGGILAEYVPGTIRNSIISGNLSVANLSDDAGAYYSTVNYSLVEDPTGNQVGAGVGNLTAVPANLGLLANNGGLTQTMLPNAGSPVLNAADPAATLGVDQRGFLRPGGNASRDMGAVERDGTPPQIPLDFNNDGKYNCGDMDLLEAAIDLGTPVATFDVNGDSILSKADVFEWLMDAGALRFGTGRVFRLGDANLDGLADGSDFGIWNGNKFTVNRRWCGGDFNQDNVTDGSDFGIWNANKFTMSDTGRPAPGRGSLRDATTGRDHPGTMESARSAGPAAETMN
ncbi:MAG TPA: choice-of-anchor Q domain-containing protein, partial [Pirellulaceae bacterium]